MTEDNFNKLTLELFAYSNHLLKSKLEITSPVKIKSTKLLSQSLKKIFQYFNLFDNNQSAEDVSYLESYKGVKVRNKKIKTNPNQKPHKNLKKKCIKTKKIVTDKNMNKSNNNNQNNQTYSTETYIRPPMEYKASQNSSIMKSTNLIHPIIQSHDIPITLKDTERIRCVEKQILIIENLFDNNKYTVKIILQAIKQIGVIDYEIYKIFELLKQTNDLENLVKFNLLLKIRKGLMNIKTEQILLIKSVKYLNSRRRLDRILLCLKRRDVVKNLLKINEMEKRNFKRDIVLLSRSFVKD